MAAMQNMIGFLQAYGAFWRHYADFGSRTSKEAFWKAWAIHIAITLATSAPLFFYYQEIIENGMMQQTLWLLPSSIYSIATLIPTIAIILRRLHDIDRNGCWIFLLLIPIVGQIILYVMWARPSAPYDTYPGKSGEGPYSEPQNPYAGFPPPYGQPGWDPYGQPGQPYTQQPYTQQPYYPPPYYYRPLPPPRRYAPGAGGNHALGAIVLSIILVVASYVYSFATMAYVFTNIDRYIDVMFGDLFSNAYGDIFNDPYGGYGFGDEYGGGSDPWGGGWGDEYGGSGDEYGGGLQPTDELSPEEQAAIDMVREGFLPGFPEFTIEQVLLSQADMYGLDWIYFDEMGGVYPDFYVISTGHLDGTFLQIYAEFEVSDDGTITLNNLDDGSRDEYGGDAVEFYREWYEQLLSGTDSAAS
jgi:uncharacterized membrane protein YhaH (DUF805 family)